MASPIQYALNNIGKKAQQLFNPVGQAISRVPQQFGNYIQKTPQYQGAQMYQRALQSPQVRNMGQQFLNAQRPSIQGLNTARQIVTPFVKANANILGQGLMSWQRSTPHGQAIQQLSQNLPTSSTNPIGNTYLKALAPFRKPTSIEDVGNVASAVYGAPKVVANTIGGGIGYGINKFTKEQSDANAFQGGYEFSSKIGGIGKLLETPLAPLVKRLNPTAAVKIGQLIDKGLTKEAFKQLMKNVGTSTITGGIEGGAFGAVQQAKNKEAWAKNIFDNATQFAAFSGGTSLVSGLGTIGAKTVWNKGGNVVRAGQNVLNKALGGKGMPSSLQFANAEINSPMDKEDVQAIFDIHKRASESWMTKNKKLDLNQHAKDMNLIDGMLVDNYGASVKEVKSMSAAEKINTLFSIARSDSGIAYSDVKLPTQTGAAEDSVLKYAIENGKSRQEVLDMFKSLERVSGGKNDKYMKQLGIIAERQQLAPSRRVNEAVDILRELNNKTNGSQYMREIAEIPKRGISTEELNIIKTRDAKKISQLSSIWNKPSLPTQVEGKYLYHGTGETALENIAKEGLKPGRHTGNISLSPNEAYAQNWAKGGITPQGKTEGVMLRVNQDLLKTKILPSKSGVKADQLNELISKEVIPPEALEIFKDGKWQPLKSLQIEGLAKEASKYKSAEEFVKGQGKPLYHGTNEIFETFDANKARALGERGDNLWGAGFYTSPGSKTAKNYGENLMELYGKPKKTLDLSKFKTTKQLGEHLNISEDALMMRNGIPTAKGSQAQQLSSHAKELGYDSIFTPVGEGEMVILDPSLVKTKSQLTDIFNQSKGVQNADLSIKLPVAPQVVNGKIKMRPISAPTLETPAALSSNQELVGSGAGGGSSIKSTQEIINPQDPYFNVKRLNIDPKKQQAVKVAIEEAKPQFEAVVGKKLSNKEVVDFSNQSAKVLNKAVNREQTKQWSASMLKAREQLAISAQDDKLTPEFLDTLINVKSQGADIARKLQSLSINADPKSVTAKQAILEAVLKVTDDSAKILEAAKGVNFNDQAQATAFYRQFVKPKAEDWLTLVRYNSMLSSPNTHLVNTSSNFQGTGLVAPVEKTVLGGIDWMRSKATGTDRRYYAGEGVEYAKGYYSNLKNASENFTKVMRGESLSGNPDIRQLPLTTKKGLARTTEHVLNYPMRLLEGMDQFFSTLTQGGVERSLTYRQGKGIKVGNIESQAQQEAANRLFRGDVGGKDQGTLLRAIDQVTNLVFRARSNENPIVRTIATFTFPFVKTPMNVVKQMVEYSPAGILTLHGAKFKQEQLAKALMGAGVALGASQLLSSDRLTWAEPTNDKQRNAFRAAGLQPYAIKIGDKWISYAKLHPVIGFNLAMVASLNESFKNKKLSESEVETALTGLSKWWGYFADQSYIKNMGDLVASARGDLSGTARMLSNYPTQVIPFRALMSWVERIVDPYQRQADPNGSMLEKQLQLIGSQIPGIAGNVPTRNNLYGEPIKNQNRMINAVSPARVTTEVPDQKQIYDNMVEKSILTKQIKDIKDQAKQGKVVTGDATSTLNMGSDEVMKARFEASGDGAWNLGGKLYIKTDSGGVKVVDLQPNPTGNAIQQAKQSASNESQIKTTGVNAYFSTKLSDFDKNTIYKALGTNAQDVEFKALASLPDEKQASVLYGLLKDRKWKQEKVDAFIKSDVLTNNVVGKMEDQGLINEAQAKDLKAYIKSTSIKLGKVSGSSKKAKKIKMPKLKAIKVKYSKLKIKIPKPKKYKSLLSKGRSNKYFK